MPIPYVTIENLTRTKISDEEGYSSAEISFNFDIRVIEYIIRCTGTNEDTGILVGNGNTYVATQANKTVEEMTNETVIDVSSFPAITTITEIIDYTELYGEGNNRINIYGLSEESPRYWTPYDQA